MKLFKALSVVTLLMISLVLVGCTNNSVLDSLTRSVEAVDQSVGQGELQEIVELSNPIVNYGNVIQLSDNTLIQEFRILRIQLMESHVDLQTERLVFAENRLLLQTQIQSFKELELELSEADRDVILEKIKVLKTYRQDLLETKGEAYLRIYHLRGQYNIENLEEINQTFIEVNEVLITRENTFISINQEMSIIINILNQYLES
jgi:hypothetical protein